MRATVCLSVCLHLIQLTNPPKTRPACSLAAGPRTERAVGARRRRNGLHAVQGELFALPPQAPLSAVRLAGVRGLLESACAYGRCGGDGVRPLLCDV